MSGLPKVMQEKLEQARREEEEQARQAAAAPATGAQEGAGAGETSGEGGTTTSYLEPASGASSAPVDSGQQTPIDSSSDLAKLNAQLERMQNMLERVLEENSELKKALKEKTEPAPKPAEPQIQIEDLSEEERAAYKQSLPVIEKVARKFAAEMAQPLLKQVRTLEERLAETKNDYSTMSERMFSATVQDRVKDFQAKLNSPRWATYLQSKIPRTNLTVKDALLNAHRSRDLETIVEIFAEFKLESTSLTSQAMPGTVKAAPATKVEEKLKFSDRAKISEDFRKGRISKQRFDELVAAYDRAEREGRVNFDS